jgi:hypothetical protein
MCYVFVAHCIFRKIFLPSVGIRERGAECAQACIPRRGQGADSSDDSNKNLKRKRKKKSPATATGVSSSSLALIP